MLTSTLRQGPIYPYNIFSLLQEDSVLKIGEEVNLPRKNVKRARARENREIYISSQAPVTSTVTGSLGTSTLGTNMDRRCLRPMIGSSTVTNGDTHTPSLGCHGNIPDAKNKQLQPPHFSLNAHTSQMDSYMGGVTGIVDRAAPGQIPLLRVCTVQQASRAALASLDLQKIQRIQSWINTGQYTAAAAQPLCNAEHPKLIQQQLDFPIKEDEMLRGHHKLADFMAFEGAYVVEINIAGCRSTALLDCGASKTLATSAYI